LAGPKTAKKGNFWQSPAGQGPNPLWDPNNDRRSKINYSFFIFFVILLTGSITMDAGSILLMLAIIKAEEVMTAS
jgi:hypothetical protein